MAAEDQNNVSNDRSESFPRILEGGIAAEHPPPAGMEVFAGPATAAERNTIQNSILAVACWGLDDIRFEFDSSFVLPTASQELPHLAALRLQHPGAPLSVFGHADPIGNDDYNKTLSGRRAQVIYGLLTRDTELWEDLHTHPFGGDHWGVKTTQYMLEAVGHSPGAVDGESGPATAQAIKEFQEEQELADDGIAGPLTRAKLFLAYMDALCRDEKGQPYQLAKSDFLAQGADAGGKGDYQGCGEFNPLRMFSQVENDVFAQSADKSGRNRENAPNRRVVIFLFRPGSQISPERWPCPSVKEGVGGCLKRFFVDAAARRSFQAERRDFERTHDTFACRFYQRIAGKSPCETARLQRITLVVRLLDGEKVAIPNAVYRLKIGRDEIRDAVADGTGKLEEFDVLAPSRCTVQWGRPESVDLERGIFPYQVTLFLGVDDGISDQAAKRRLHNLGYGVMDTLEESIRLFQQDYNIKPVTGILDPITRAKLVAVHDALLGSNEA